jgi:L-amino acid N-acyltransferase YncA
MDFSLLFTGINDYYARVGYATVPRENRSGPLRPDFAPSSSGWRVRPIEGRDLPEVRQIYAAYNARRPITVQRSEAYWRDWLGVRPDNLPEGVFVAEDERGRMGGYARLGQFKSAIPYNSAESEARLMEIGAHLDDPGRGEDALRALLESVATQSLEKGVARLQLSIPLEPPMERLLDSILESVSAQDSRFGMMRLLHRMNLLRSFTFEWNDRWAQAGRPKASVDFETPYGPVRLEAAGDFLRVEPTDAPTDALSQADLFRLLFGAVAPDRLTSDESRLALLTTLFPNLYPTYWGADGF